MPKHGQREKSNDRWKTKNKATVWSNVHFDDIKRALQKSWNDKEGFENITKLRTRSKGKGFKNLLPRDERKLKQLICEANYFWPSEGQERQRV